MLSRKGFCRPFVPFLRRLASRIRFNDEILPFQPLYIIYSVRTKTRWCDFCGDSNPRSRRQYCDYYEYCSVYRTIVVFWEKRHNRVHLRHLATQQVTHFFQPEIGQADWSTPLPWRQMGGYTPRWLLFSRSASCRVRKRDPSTTHCCLRANCLRPTSQQTTDPIHHQR